MWEFALQQGAALERLHVTEPIVKSGVVCGVRGRMSGQVVDRPARITIAADGARSVVARAFSNTHANTDTYRHANGHADTDAPGALPATGLEVMESQTSAWRETQTGQRGLARWPVDRCVGAA